MQNKQDKTKKTKKESKVSDLKPAKDPKGGFPPDPYGPGHGITRPGNPNT